MALADIITRIEADASAEAATVLADARARADELLASAKADAERTLADAEARAERDAGVEAATVLANARLAARDSALAARTALVDEALARTAAAIAALPADAYAAFFARRIADEARGGEHVRVAAADRDRLAGLPAAIAAAAPGLTLAFDTEPADVEHGVVLAGDRVRVDLSLAAIIEEGRDDLEIVVARALFGEEGA